jgi:hypothetical protein
MRRGGAASTFVTRGLGSAIVVSLVVEGVLEGDVVDVADMDSMVGFGLSRFGRGEVGGEVADII